MVGIARSGAVSGGVILNLRTHGRDGKRVKDETVSGRKAEKIYSAWF